MIQATFKILDTFFVFSFICCLMNCDCFCEQMTAASQEQAERRYTSSLDTSAANDAQYDAGESHNQTAEGRNGLQRLYTWSLKKAPLWVTVPVMALSVLSILYHAFKAVVDCRTRHCVSPNDCHHPRCGE